MGILTFGENLAFRLLKAFSRVALIAGKDASGPRRFATIAFVIPFLFTTAIKAQTIESWITKSDQTSLLQKQAEIQFATVNNSNPTITVDDSQKFQSIDGFGYTLTGGSAYVINKLNAAEKAKLLRELFANDENSIGISYLRLSLGASDLNDHVFSYDDLAAGETDLELKKFDLGPDKTDVVPLLKEILKINPRIKILSCPWSPPVWMKDNGSSKGGSLQPKYYDVYARYFVKYIQTMKSDGVTIDAITPQNEPLHPGNNPSLLMTAPEQTEFIKNHLGPVFQKNGIKTKIIIYDHNVDRPDYPIEVLNDPAAKKYIDGSAFHLYKGEISALTTVHDAHPDKSLYFTEQYTPSNGNFGRNLTWHLKNVIIGSVRNWSRNALEWNLANDASFNPHTPGGCTTCKGALTIDNGNITRNVGYYIIAHASKFVSPGSIRIGSNTPENLNNVAFIANGKSAKGRVLIVENDGTAAAVFNIKYKNKWAVATLPGGAVGTYRW